MTIKLDAVGHNTAAMTPELIQVKLAQDIARIVTAGESDLTDNSAGAADADHQVLDVADVAEIAVVGTNLADKNTSEAALGTVRDAIATLFGKANALAAKVGVDQVTYNGGGTDGAGTVAAITVAVTGAITGAQDAETNALFGKLNDGFFTLGSLVNKLCGATGVAKLDLQVVGTYANPVPVIAVGVGVAAAPAVSKVAMDAALAVFADNAATVAARLNALTAAFSAPQIVVNA